MQWVLDSRLGEVLWFKPWPGLNVMSLGKMLYLNLIAKRSLAKCWGGVVSRGLACHWKGGEVATGICCKFMNHAM